jgi:hypothetical protein
LPRIPGTETTFSSVVIQTAWIQQMGFCFLEKGTRLRTLITNEILHHFFSFLICEIFSRYRKNARKQVGNRPGNLWVTSAVMSRTGRGQTKAVSNDFNCRLSSQQAGSRLGTFRKRRLWSVYERTRRTAHLPVYGTARGLIEEKTFLKNTWGVCRKSSA